jgi:hypothetical protein
MEYTGNSIPIFATITNAANVNTKTTVLVYILKKNSAEMALHNQPPYFVPLTVTQNENVTRDF